MREEENCCSESECFEILDELFPRGPGAKAVIDEPAPEGWKRSPFVRVFHPTLEQVYEEALRFHRNSKVMRRWACPPPTLEEVRADYRTTPVKPRQECTDLVCECLWDVFSDNHEVIARDGRCVDLGSFRGSAGLLADWLNRHQRTSRYNYLSFYMGTTFAGRRADLTPVYRLIFRRMRPCGLDWIYHLPELFLVPLGEDTNTVEGYDLSEAIEQESQMRELEAKVEEDHRHAVEDARRRGPPKIVRAFRFEYGHDPRGWPPE